jgi:addiction module HigA family antidote
MTTITSPPPPGLVLRHKILNRSKVRQADLARAMGVSRVRLSQILNGHAPISVEMALRLAHVTGTEAEYWLTLQMEFGLFRARSRLAVTLEALATIELDQT